MTKNVGNVDRLLRIVVGLLLLWFTYTGAIGSWGWIVGAIVLATGVLRFCALYRLIGFNTCRTS